MENFSLVRMHTLAEAPLEHSSWVPLHYKALGLKWSLGLKWGHLAQERVHRIHYRMSFEHVFTPHTAAGACRVLRFAHKETRQELESVF